MQYHTFRGKKFRILLTEGLPESWYGSCENPRAAHPTIRIRSSLPLDQKIETAIHEALHACDWDKSEDAITEMGKDIGRFVYRLFHLEAEKKEKL